MPEKQNRRAARRGAGDDDAIALTDGVIGRLVDHAFDNPAMTGGLFVMALTTSAIISNALFLQDVRHPEPLFSTRPSPVIERHEPAAPPSPRQSEQTASIPQAPPPLPRPAPTPAAVPTPPPIPVPAPATAAKAEETALVREIQTLLARKGLYLGAIDGIYGSLSRSAIAAYEKAEGLPVTGQPSASLLEHMKRPAATPATPAPSSGPKAEAPAAEPAAKAPSRQEVEAEIERLRYQRVQTALNRIGYGPVTVNGGPSEETSEAIRRFELDNGLPISGVAGEAVIERMVAIGAMPAT